MSQSQALSARQMRMVYLITYSQADERVCASREEFAAKVVGAFTAGAINVTHWACCKESHQDGGHHYHIAVKLEKGHRWIRVKQRLQSDHDMVVHFSSTHVNYYSAYQYVAKSDEGVLLSPGHPDLQEPRTSAASARRAGPSSQPGEPRPKKKRLSSFDVSEIVRARNIKTRTELMALAEEQRNEGKTDLAEFVVNRGAKRVAEAIQVTS